MPGYKVLTSVVRSETDGESVKSLKEEDNEKCPDDMEEVVDRYRDRGPLGLLCLWTDSVYELCWKESVIYFGAYVILAFITKYVISDERETQFEEWVLYIRAQLTHLPAPLMGFVVGFFVVQVTSQWWSAFENMPWGETVAAKIIYDVRSKDENPRVMTYRSELIRYMNLETAVVFAYLNTGFRKSLLALQHHGLQLCSEKEWIDIREMERRTGQCAHWLPGMWFSCRLREAVADGVLVDPKPIEQEIAKHRERCKKLMKFQWIRVPLAYTQVVTLLVYGYMALALVGRQFISSDDINLWLPIDIVLIIEYLIFVGWLKVAIAMFYPFGDDSTDFNLLLIMKANIEITEHMLFASKREAPPFSAAVGGNSPVSSIHFTGLSNSKTINQRGNENASDDDL